LLSGEKAATAHMVGGEIVDFSFPVYWSTCAVKGLLFQQVQVLSRQRSFQPGSYPSGHGGNEVAEAWGKETALGRLQVGRP